MKAAIAFALFLSFITSDKQNDAWQPFASVDSKLKFEMPKPPTEQVLKSGAGTDVRTFVCEKDEIVFEAISIEMTLDLKMALQEASSDAEVSVSRQVIDGMLEDSLDEMELKSSKDEYTRIQKLPCRISVAKISKEREAKLLSVIGKDHAYQFIVSYPTSNASAKPVKRFFESIQFES